MQLWNDYEGKTIAEVYPLGQLLRPEGRSALFALSGGVDAPAIIRLTESLNDEGQMMECWKRVTEVHQENLLQIKRFGRTNFEGTPLAYAVMEITDANLADLLRERPVTHPEALQLATSVAAALTALHAKNLVHEHIAAVNVLAAGETVKLRTDCVREFIVDDVHPQSELDEVMQKDVQDFGRLLLHSLTLDQRMTPNVRLAAPFDKIVPNALSGSWGLAEISEALKPAAVSPLVPESVSRPAVAASRVFSASTPPPAPARVPAAPPQQQKSAPAEPLVQGRRWYADEETGRPRQQVLVWAGCVGAVLLLLTLVLHSLKSRSAGSPQVATRTAAPAQVSSAAAASGVVAATPGLAASNPNAAASNPNAAASNPRSSGTPAAAPAPAGAAASTATNRVAVTAHMQPGWYVVAYTYNREDQAWKRVASIVKRHPSLNPQVIAPSGHTPYLISLGGAMSRSDAEAARTRARRAGMPRDTFVRNYQGTQS